MATILAWFAGWFVIWSVSFWLLLGAETIALIAFLYDDEDVCPYKALFSIFITLALLQFIGKIPITQTIAENPMMVVVWAGLYIIIGCVWMCLKWYMFVKSKFRKYEQEVRDEFVRENKIKSDEIPADLKPLLKKRLENELGYGSEEAPQVSNFKDELFAWFYLWPLSGLWTLINDPVKRLFEWIYYNIRGQLQGVSDRIWRRVIKDIGADRE